MVKYYVTLFSCPSNINSAGACPDFVDPVCGMLTKGGLSQYSNSCEACMNGEISGYFKGSCPARSYPEGFKSCPILKRNEPIPCEESENGVCVYAEDGKMRTYKMGCYACSYKMNNGYLLGECPEGMQAEADEGSLFSAMSECERW